MALPKVDIHFIGQTSKDVPTLRTTPNGRKVTNVRVAVTPKSVVNSSTPGAGKEYIDEKTQWYDVEIWGHEAEGVVAAIQSAGGSIALEVTGELNHRDYDAKDGTKRTSFEIKRATVSVPFNNSQTLTVSKKPYQNNNQSQQSAAPQQGYHQQVQHPAQNNNYDWGTPAQGYDNSQWGAPASDDQAPF